MNPLEILQLVNLGVVLAGTGFSAFAKIKAATVSGPAGSQTYEVVITIEEAKLDEMLASLQATDKDLADEIARRNAAGV